jgi:hypothetical protein
MATRRSTTTKTPAAWKPAKLRPLPQHRPVLAKAGLGSIDFVDLGRRVGSTQARKADLPPAEEAAREAIRRLGLPAPREVAWLRPARSSVEGPWYPPAQPEPWGAGFMTLERLGRLVTGLCPRTVLVEAESASEAVQFSHHELITNYPGMEPIWRPQLHYSAPARGVAVFEACWREAALRGKPLPRKDDVPAALRGRPVAEVPSPFEPLLEVYRLGFLFRDFDDQRIVLEVVGH